MTNRDRLIAALRGTAPDAAAKFERYTDFVKENESNE